MKQILFGLFESSFADVLGFKGGTLAYLCYGLDRFSTDLDIDLLDISQEQVVRNFLDSFLWTLGEVKNMTVGKDLHRWVFRYDEASWNIKIEINKRLNPYNRYKWREIDGHRIQCMEQISAVSNKLLALSNRRYNRDLYDIHFFLSKGYSFDKEIISYASGKSVAKLIAYLLENIHNHYTEDTILHELSMVITDQQKARVKPHLLNETISLLKQYREEK